MSVFSDLTDSGINFSVASISGSGLVLELLTAEGTMAARGYVGAWNEVEDWMKEKAIEHFPDSRFAGIYGVVARFG